MKPTLALLLLSTLAGCQSLVEVHAEPDLSPLRDAADALGYHGAEMVSRLPSPLVATELTVSEGALQIPVTLTVDREAVHVAPGAVVVNVHVPVDDAVAVLLPLLDERSQQALDDLRTSVGRDSRELTQTMRDWLPWFFVLMCVAVAAFAWERVTDNRGSKG